MTQTCPVGRSPRPSLRKARPCTLAGPALTALGFVPAISVKKEMLAVGKIWQTHLETTVGGPRAV